VGLLLPRGANPIVIAGRSLVSVIFAFGRIVGNPALHVHAGIWAAEDEYSHAIFYLTSGVFGGK
jgi:hypothetical protein